MFVKNSEYEEFLVPAPPGQEPTIIEIWPESPEMDCELHIPTVASGIVQTGEQVHWYDEAFVEVNHSESPSASSDASPCVQGRAVQAPWEDGGAPVLVQTPEQMPL